MKDDKIKANTANDAEKTGRSTKKTRTERKAPNPPVPNRAHTEMKKSEEK